ncbi:hypothetical protein GCM10009117_11500 [Gangjinia marincola]|uniref:SRPBCC family protein n=1 Tax=Gangjinia marincola TaxID=578463 RepID=A0ABP3XUV5_9FLAO
MKYTTQIKINVPLEHAIKLFEEAKNFPKWQRGLISTKAVDQPEGEVGSKRTLKLKIYGQKIKMTETITKKNLPHVWHAIYRSNGITTMQENYFESIDENTMQWNSVSRFKFTGLLSIVGRLQPELFKQRSLQIMKDFKAFAEDGQTVNS